MHGVDAVLDFWLDQLSPKDWYVQSDTLDDTIRKEFGKTWEMACEGHFSLWLTYPSGVLAYIILTDQFPRNMFREDGRAFASDAAARAAAVGAISKNWDLKIDGAARQFFYMPLMHSEDLEDQDFCVSLFETRMESASNLLHARAHRDVIRDFGRFPYRNAALGRETTAAERAYLEAGAYGSTVRKLEHEAEVLANS